MKIYLVGGAVRDALLSIPSPDRDWVVVGSTPEEMATAGYQAVGKDFPVFLHPESKEEFALARQERKSGRGYKGFQFYTDKSITLEEDLIRRDLTVNAMAMDENNTIIDPYGGQEDINKRLLRHVSPAFGEDPVRVLRVARFAARFHHLGFHIAGETQELMTEMVNNGEIDHLVRERVWKECVRALAEPSPPIFIEVLHGCGALARLMPELEKLFGIPQPEEHHPEIDTGLHALLSLQRCAALTHSTEARFAALIHDLGKGETAQSEWPRHIGHETKGLPMINQLCDRLSVPNPHRELALAVAEFHTHCHRAFELTAKTLLKTLQRLDAFRRPERFALFCICCQADAQGRTGMENTPYPQAEYFKSALRTLQQIDTKAMARQGLKGAAFGEALLKKRQATLAEHKRTYRGDTP
ncbi:multifunctional CCA addition/repair protein [Teredinibacter haidensis]|uniref:multifunctional CCA addition/repair protein n=1 Tax=Teredinibacter haidensis TaxID=2731755 RepID=UPI000948CFF4|nr:multifunctional CCA addition/repair protein [Teredinibacter haidensis]